MSEPPAIAVRGLRHGYGGAAALDGVSFDVPAGGFLALLGRNGAGKTTLVNAVCALLRPDAGEVTVYGRDARRAPRAVRRQFGLVFQDPTVDERLTLRENLAIHARLYGVPRRERGDRIHAALARVDLAGRANERAGALSRGLKRRLEIARALVHGPRVLVLDEPTAGLDAASRRDLRALVGELRARDAVAVLLTTHLIEEAEDADRIAVLDRGRLCALDTPGGLRARTPAPPLRLTFADADAASAAANALTVPRRRAGATLWVQAGDRCAHLADLLSDPDARAQVTGVELAPPTLEDAFLHLTGGTEERDA
ncbi:ABC-2 type transport system ATP-binding protein [Limimonas halophila]|uniref:ABC-2 type transport system ATP-binding protein n=1 Tax=Limimonas halophila TaxID=1082479 RepID=A0A1G7RIA8_9PROT|nr:ABC transporter ATP-binding protein [Limimonas halophila]SDG10481.1 ABC-2 type transport system ATP-binding protein [Limimonas halophila]